MTVCLCDGKLISEQNKVDLYTEKRFDITCELFKIWYYYMEQNISFIDLFKFWSKY